MRTEGYLNGQMLIAMPGIGDPRFERAVVLICAHDGSHAMGLAVNRPVGGLTVPELLRTLSIPIPDDASPDLVLLGGPVETERGFVLHTDDYQSTEGQTAKVGAGWGITATRDVLEAMARGGSSPRRAILALGYAGWGAGQLEFEIRQNVWLICEADEGLIFDPDHEAKWNRALAKLGVDASLLSAEAGRA